MHAVVETTDFLSDARDADIEEPEREEIINYLANHPTAGVVIPGTGGARKIRFAGRGKGKSGGYVLSPFSMETISRSSCSTFSPKAIGWT